jgi:hypothetical protein
MEVKKKRKEGMMEGWKDGEKIPPGLPLAKGGDWQKGW